ncbi:MAG: putative transcriptional regulator [Labilithrix sp.]|nr:putative transcriptional regulator [Labilithrix sp.]
MSHSVGRLARRFGVSRTTLLYYDRIGLLSPSGRSAAGYRVYGEREVERLEAIRRYRAGGLALEEIRVLVDREGGRAADVLERQLARLHAEIEVLREQQQVVARLLATSGLLRTKRGLDKARWVTMLRAAGFDDDAMHRWHVAFERTAPAAHGEFLAALGLAAADIARIRRWSRG